MLVPLQDIWPLPHSQEWHPYTTPTGVTLVYRYTPKHWSDTATNTSINGSDTPTHTGVIFLHIYPSTHWCATKCHNPTHTHACTHTRTHAYTHAHTPYMGVTPLAQHKDLCCCYLLAVCVIAEAAFVLNQLAECWRSREAFADGVKVTTHTDNTQFSQLSWLHL